MHYCMVKGCENKSNKASKIKFYSLPLKNKVLLANWLKVIPRKSDSISIHSRICSDHFSEGSKKSKDAVPSVFPNASTAIKRAYKERNENIEFSRKKFPKAITKVRHDHTYAMQPNHECSPETYLTVLESDEVKLDDSSSDSNGRTEEEVVCTSSPIHVVSKSTNDFGVQVNGNFCIESIQDNDNLINFYTGFSNFSTLLIVFNFLGESAYHLNYNSKSASGESLITGAPRKLTPLNEFFLLLCRLRCGLLEIDLAYRFGVSQATVSRILSTWINFVYYKLKEVNIWPDRNQVDLFMPKSFKDTYPTTRCIIDATEIFTQMPSNPIAQQLTFSSYKNHNTLKALIAITPSGAISFISNLYGGSISDRQLTLDSGLIDLLEPGDSVMADRGFTISDILDIKGVGLNIPPQKLSDQLTEEEVVKTRRIANLRIHVERAIGRIKTFRILNDIPVNMAVMAEEIFFVCSMLSNFSKPLCSK